MIGIKTFLLKNERYIKTFIEAFFSYIAIHIMSLDLTSKTAISALLAGAIGSGLSVLFNRKSRG